MAKNEIKEQLKSFEGYINDIPLVIDPCKMCKIYKEHKGWFMDEFKNGEWKEGPCKKCCWFYGSRFEVSI